MTLRPAWLTDIHLDHVPAAARPALYASVRDSGADAVLLGGDISTFPKLERDLLELRGLPIYFVLGNHDCYGGSIARARSTARRLTERDIGLTWLGAVDAVPLTEHTTLIGHDGWGDGGFGNAATTPVRLNDFLMIDELRLPKRERLLAALKASAPSRPITCGAPARQPRSGAGTSWSSPTSRRSPKRRGTRAPGPMTTGCRSSPAAPRARRSPRSPHRAAA